MSEPLMKGVGLQRAFGGIHAVDDIDVSIGARDLLCVIGPNGAGKSTLVGLLSGSIRPGAGELYFDGQRMTGRPMHQFCRRGVMRKFQGTNTFLSMSVRDNLLVAGLGVTRYRKSPMPDPEAILEEIGLSAQADLPAATLPHGERQWLENRHHRLRERCAVLAIEHDLAFVRALQCETWVMHRGQIVRQGTYDDIARDEEIRRIYLGKGATYAAH